MSTKTSELAKPEARFVRPNKGLPLTLMIIGQGKSIGGEDIWLVKEFGFARTFGVVKRDVHPIDPSSVMLEQLNGWLHMINFSPTAETIELWKELSATD